MSNAELARALPWRENEGEVNVFGKPDEQRPSLLGLCHGEKTKAKPTSSLSTSGVGKAKHLSSIPTDHGEVTDKVNDKVETTY